jgi:hypothetical protein
MSNKMFSIECPDHKAVHRTSFHYAEIQKGNKILASSRNRIGSRSRGCGWSDQTLHAERAAVKALGDLSQLRGCVLIVVRVGKHNEVMGSKPCHDCEKFLTKCMVKWGLSKVIYS